MSNVIDLFTRRPVTDLPRTPPSKRSAPKPTASKQTASKHTASKHTASKHTEPAAPTQRTTPEAARLERANPKAGDPRAAKPKAAAPPQRRSKRPRKLETLYAEVLSASPDDYDLLDQAGVLHLERRKGRVTWAQFDCDNPFIDSVEIHVKSFLPGPSALILVDTDGVRWVFGLLTDPDLLEHEDRTDYSHPFNR